MKCSLGIVVPASLFDVSDTGFDLLSHKLATLETGLDLSKIVVSGHTVHEASNKIGGVLDGQVLSTSNRNNRTDGDGH